MRKIKETLFGTKFYNSKRCSKLQIFMWSLSALMLFNILLDNALYFLITSLLYIIVLILGIIELRKPFDLDKMQEDELREDMDFCKEFNDLITSIERKSAWIAIKPVLHSLKELEKNTWDVERVASIRRWLIANFMYEEPTSHLEDAIRYAVNNIKDKNDE